MAQSTTNLGKIHVFPSESLYNQFKDIIASNDLALLKDDGAYIVAALLEQNGYVKFSNGLILQDVIRAMSRAKVGYASQKKCRQLLHNLYNYAVKYEIISASADISKYIDIDKKKIVYPKSPFNTRQLNRVKRLAESSEPLSKWAKVVVMMVYSGVRPSEMLAVKKCDVKLKQRYFIVRKSKTEAGENRAVPISRKALPYYQLWMQEPGKTLITDNNGEQLSYHRFRARFDKVMDATSCHHTPHECRHTCATMLDNAGANDTAVKRILGHASPGVTKGTYTHKSLHELKKAIDMI